MRARRSQLVLACALATLIPATAWAQSAAQAARVDALIGLARAERSAGRTDRAFELFAEADRITRFVLPLLSEFFWTAVEINPLAADQIGRRALAAEPAQQPVRDKLIALAAFAHDERRVMELASEGIRIQPRSALWHRRLGESLLRQSQAARAAAEFSRAAEAQDATRTDAAQAALSLQVAGAMQAAYKAWLEIDRDIWASRPEWAASRIRTLAAVDPPLAAAKAVKEYLDRFPADEQAVALLVELYEKAHRPALALEALKPLVASKAGASRARWVRRESELAIEAGDIERAIRALDELSRAGLASETDEEKRARLLASVGDESRFYAALQSLERTTGHCSTTPLEVLAALPDPHRLIEALQAHQARCPISAIWLDRGVALAVAAGLHAQALALLERRLAGHDGSVDQRELHGQLLLWVGEPRRAIPVLEGLLAIAPGRRAATDALIDALRADGRTDEAWIWAKRLLAMTPADRGTRIKWAQLALDAHQPAAALSVIERETSSNDVEDVASRSVRSIRGQALAQLGRFQEARAILETIVDNPALPFDPSAADHYATALAESGDLDRALDVMARLVAIRPQDLGWQARESDWGLRRAKLIAERDGPEAAEHFFIDLAARRDASAAVYLTWAHAFGSSSKAQRILADGVSRFPEAALLQEQLAIERWSAGDVKGAAQAASRAVALDGALTRAAMIEVECVRRTAAEAEVVRALDRFEARFGENGTAMLELADRLSGAVQGADDPLTDRMIAWVDRLGDDPDVAARARLTKARLLAAARSWTRALESLDAVPNTSSDFSAALKLRAEILSYAGDYAASIAAYDAYLAHAPHDIAARRQQARVEGWRQAYGAARARYRDAIRAFPNDRVIPAEAAAKSAYYDERWRRAIAAYRNWLTLEPGDTEGRFELAQAYDQAGEYDEAGAVYASLAAEAPPHRQAQDAYARLRDRRAIRTSFSAETQSARGYGGTRLLEQSDSLAHLAGSVGSHTWMVAAGPSRIGDKSMSSGSRLNAGIRGNATPSWRLSADLAAHRYATMESAFVGGGASVGWTPTDRLLVGVGFERTPLLENRYTVEQNAAVNAARAILSYRPSSGVWLDAAMSEGRLTDRNRRFDARLSVTQRLFSGRNEIRLLGIVEDSEYRDARAEYFSPAQFWKEHLGLTYRRQFETPKYSGDRERWLESTYLAGVDQRGAVYHSASAGITYEFRSGVGLTAAGTVTRSSVYTSSGLTVVFRLKPFSQHQ